jgi:hypothetical protein
MLQACLRHSDEPAAAVKLATLYAGCLLLLLPCFPVALMMLGGNVCMLPLAASLFRASGAGWLAQVELLLYSNRDSLQAT